MQIFLLALFLFLVGCFLGWLLEVFFRRFFSAKKWVNPGFMKGPWLPLYGFGVLLMFSICHLCISFFPESIKFYNPVGGLFERDYVSGPTAMDLVPISLMWIGMVLLEFLAGLIFIKGFHVKLWDYTNMRGNIMGIICPVFTVIWLAVAVIFYYGIDPFMYLLSTNAHKYMFGGDGALAHFGFIFFLGLVYGLMLYDFVTSIGVFNAISKFARQSGVVAKYESSKRRFEEFNKETKKKLRLEWKHPSNELAEKIKSIISDTIYIDPEKEKNRPNNYDESGRPIKTDKNSIDE